MANNIQIIQTENFVIEIDKTLETINIRDIKDKKEKNSLCCCIDELLTGEEKNGTLTIKIQLF